MKTRHPLFVFTNLIFAAALGSSAHAGNESFPFLKEKELAPKLLEGTKSLRSSLALLKKTPDSRIEARGEHISWLSQCIEYISEDVSSSLWEPCLNFASQLMRIESSVERASHLVRPYQEHRRKWDETLGRMSASDRLFLNQEASNAAKTLSGAYAE